MKLGISSYTYTWAVEVPGYPVPGSPLTAFDLLKKAKELGVNILQIADNLPLHHFSDLELERLKNHANEWGIELEVGTRGIEKEHLLKYLEVAKKLGSKFVRTIIHTSKGTPGLTEAISMVKEALPYYEKAGISIAIENHDLHTVSELTYLIESVGSSYLGICLDTVNSFGALEAPEDVIRTLAPYTINVHIKDFKIERVSSQMGFSVVGCPAGEGKLDLEMLLAELKKQTKNPTVILELWTPYDGSIVKTIDKENEWATRSITYLKEKIKWEQN